MFIERWDIYKKMSLLSEDIKRIKELMFFEDEFERDLNLSKTGSDQDIVQKGPSTDDGNNDAEDGMGESELSEDEETTSTTTSTTTDTTTDTSSDTGATVKKWESGATRGKGNPIGNTKWESGRTVGSTGPKAKWESGITRGKGNPTT